MVLEKLKNDFWLSEIRVHYGNRTNSFIWWKYRKLIPNTKSFIVFQSYYFNVLNKLNGTLSHFYLFV